ncbi:ABC transporter ATP-binding protein/permease [Roseicella aerolata]|uniref:ABC transporter ATP-binding protein/permease n=1 Tax=Roseicella aerolata TaxID=2883479 RepID=A0A9X1L9D5_9PROT|nr:ABC transporter ATP-binding protein/permease [Roseicella aerolata]MCB4823569.1 ABC transporter ATP-binding protein/permease [Roseicella aerolata]
MRERQDREEEPAEGPARPWDAGGDGLLRRFLRLAGGYYASEERRSAWILTACVLGFTILQVLVQIRLNLWNRDFFDALENRDLPAFSRQIGLFLVLALAGMAVAVLQLYARQTLQLRWRAWLVLHLQQRWLERSRHYRMGFAAEAADNPDQRISENTRWATQHAVEMAVGLLQAGLMLVSFVGILWTLSGPLHVAFGANEFAIPGYMVFAAILYAMAGSGLTWLIGRPMVDINIRRNQAEADHRFALVRLRENSEGVALIRGEADEERGLRHGFARVTGAMAELFRTERRLMWLTSAYGMLLTIFPALVASPRYFAGAITLGVLMQITAAFYQVTTSLNWFVDNWPRLADWRSHAERVLALDRAFGAAEPPPGSSGIEVTEGPAEDGREVLAFRRLSVASADGARVIREAEAEIRPGERVLITGESGIGKSTLFRVIAGLWPWGSGQVRVPPHGQVMFMPQRPYLPLGTLRAAIAYPAAPGRFADAAMRAALERCGLAHLAPRLEEAQRWDRILSLGEQQRLAFARLLLHRPRWVFMDEATAALDEANQDAMMRLFREELEGTALVSIGHRPGLDAYHDRTLTLVRGTEGARLEAPRARPPAAALPRRRPAMAGGQRHARATSRRREARG